MSTTPTTSPDQGMTFDAAPVTQATPVDTTGMTFDAAPAKTAITVPSASAAPAPSASGTLKASPMATMQAPEQPKNAFDHIQQWANNVADDLRYGTDRTGIGSLLKHMGAPGLESGTTPGVADFMGSIPLGTLKMIKGGAEFLNPEATPGKLWQGTKDVAGGGLQAATIPSAFVAPESSEAIENAGNAVVSGTGKAINAAKKPFSLKAVTEALQNSKQSIQDGLQSNLQDIQSGFHDSIRDLFDSVAEKAGVQPKPAQSLNDIAANTAAAVKAKASALYKTLDNAVGGTRFQTFDEQLGNVKRALRNSAGIDPDADGRLVERINALEDAKAQALEQAKAKGVAPNLIHEANATHRQAMALEDLSKHLQASMSGLRADVAQGLPAGVKAAPEALSPAKLAPRANRLYGTGRLQQALGDDHADDLLRAIETTKQSAQDATENAAKQAEAATTKAGQQKSAVITKRVLGGLALSGTPLGFWIKHFFFE
jgi:hypothetical protein